MILSVADPAPRAVRHGRPDTRESVELRAIRERQPELADAVDMHLEFLAVQRRVQARIPLPSFELSADIMASHEAEARPLLHFEDIPLEPTDLRLVVRQTADIMRRFGALEDADQQRVQALERDMALVEIVGQWYRSGAEKHAVAPFGTRSPAEGPAADEEALDQLLTLAMRPFLSRCAEVLQQRAELTVWSHAHCPLCGGEPDLSVITRAAEPAPDLRPLHAPLEVRSADLPLLSQQRPFDDHVVCDAGRPVSRLRVQRLQALSQGVRRTAGDKAGHACRR